MKADIVTSDDIEIYYTGKFKDFTARYIIKLNITFVQIQSIQKHLGYDFYTFVFERMENSVGKGENGY